MTCMAICGHVYFYLHDLCVYINIYMIFVMNLLNPPTLFLLLNIFKVEEIMNLYGFIVYHFYDLITLQGILQKKKFWYLQVYIYIYICSNTKFSPKFHTFQNALKNIVQLGVHVVLYIWNLVTQLNTLGFLLWWLR